MDALDRDLEDLLRTDADVSATEAWTVSAIIGAAAFRHRAREPQRVGRRTGFPVVGFVGALEPGHDVASVVRAVAALRGEGLDARLLIVGEGPRRRSLEALAGELGVLGVTEFTGSGPPRPGPAAPWAVDVAVAPYGDEDGMSFSPAEAIRVPCLEPPGRGGVDWRHRRVRHRRGGAGWTYRPGDLDGLTGALRAALANPDEAARRGARGREHVEACHTWRRNAERVVALVKGRSRIAGRGDAGRGVAGRGRPTPRASRGRRASRVA